MKHILSSLLLGPILLIQGLLVRRKSIILPEPPGQRKGKSGAGENLSLLILGDSAAAGVGVDHQDYALLGQLVKILSQDFCVSWQLEATTGDTTANSIACLNKISNCQFDVVLTSLGVNDITSIMSQSKWMQQQNELQDKCIDVHGAKLVLITAVPPMGKFPALPQPLGWYLGSRANQFNRALEKLTSHKKKLSFLSIDVVEDSSEMASDGFHPGEKVYQLWALNAAEKIKSKFLK